MPDVIHIPPSELQNPEDLAMLQALYSRSDDSVTTHLEKIKKMGSAKFMERYYLNYGHASIGDCADATVFVEGVSILAAKALQDWPLYNGQECSTRYIDFTKSEFFNPFPGVPVAAEILETWREIYVKVYTKVKDDLECEWLRNHPSFESSEYSIVRNACHAKACDVARAFLPIGAKTNLSIKMPFRQFQDKMGMLLSHPLHEIRDIAISILKTLHAQYPNSFRVEDYPERQEFYKKVGWDLHYFYCHEHEYLTRPHTKVNYRLDCDTYSSNLLPADLYRERPPKTNLPRILGELGRFQFTFWLDYGSFRDIQRHRNGYCRLPMAEGNLDIHPWYYSQIPDSLLTWVQTKVSQIDNVLYTLQKKGLSKAELQYLYPLGHRVPVQVTYDLSETVYVAELRSTKYVHPTLRSVAWQMAEHFKANFPHIPIFIDDTPIEDFNVSRGKQTTQDKLSA